MRKSLHQGSVSSLAISELSTSNYQDWASRAANICKTLKIYDIVTGATQRPTDDSYDGIVINRPVTSASASDISAYITLKKKLKEGQEEFDSREATARTFFQDHAGQTAWIVLEHLPIGEWWSKLESTFAQSTGRFTKWLKLRALQRLVFVEGESMEKHLLAINDLVRECNQSAHAEQRRWWQVAKETAEQHARRLPAPLVKVDLINVDLHVTHILASLPEAYVDKMEPHLRGNPASVDVAAFTARLLEVDREVNERREIDGGGGASAFAIRAGHGRRGPASTAAPGAPWRRTYSSQRDSTAPSNSGGPRQQPRQPQPGEDARKIPNANLWPHGCTTSGLFRPGRDMCARCFGEETPRHFAKECTLAPHEAARKRAAKLLEYKIVVNPSQTYALVARLDDSADCDPAFPEWDDTELGDEAEHEHDASAHVAIDGAEEFAWTAHVAIEEHALAAAVAEGGKPRSSPSFILDSGASRSMTHRLDLLTDYVEHSPPRIKVNGAFGAIGWASGEGTLAMTFNIDGQEVRVAHAKVLHVPSLGANLISLSSILLLGYEIRGSQGVITISKGGRDAARFELRDRLFVAMASFHPRPSPTLATALSVSTPIAGSLRLHERLGHRGGEVLRALVEAGRVQLSRDAMREVDSAAKRCAACQAGRATVRPNHSPAKHRGPRVFDRVYSDVWGPAPVASLSGKRYLVGFTDDASRYRWASAVRAKSEVDGCVRRFVAYTKTQSGRPLRILRTDRGGEYSSNSLLAYLESEGIVREPTLPYEHGQMGVQERGWRTIMETVRAWLFKAELPLSLWEEAARAAVHVINLLPTAANKGTSPHERLKEVTQQHDLGKLRVWGCVAHVTLQPEQRANKLMPRSRRCYFVGYPSHSSGYRFYDPSTRRVFEAGHALFLEDEFGPKRSEGEQRAVEEWMRAEEDWGQEEVSERGAPSAGAGSGANAHRQEAQTGQPTQSEETDDSTVDSPQDANAPDSTVDVDSSATQPAGTPDSPPAETVAPAPEGYELVLRHDPTDEDSLASKWGGGVGSRLRSGRSGEAALSAVAGEGELTRASLDLELDGDDVAALSVSTDTPTFRQAMAGSDRDKWETAIETEKAALRAMGTFSEPVDPSLLPKGRSSDPISCKWVLLVKRDGDGQITKYKARLVARGDMQIPGVHYSETYSPTSRTTSHRLLMALAAQHRWQTKQFDVSSAYLHGALGDHTVHMRMPDGSVVKLLKALYGLCQAGREWNEVLHKQLTKIGFARCEHDHAVYRRIEGSKNTYMSIHVDDGMVTGDGDLAGAIAGLGEAFTVKDLGEVTQFVGMQVTRDGERGAIVIAQSRLIQELLEKTRMESCASQESPTAAKPSTVHEEKTVSTETRLGMPYRSIVGVLNYLAWTTRPDIAFAVSKAARFCVDPRSYHWDALEHLIKYLKGSSRRGIAYRASDDEAEKGSIDAFVDADHGADPETRRSVTGYVFRMAGGAISWTAKRQSLVTVSSTEAEYVAMSFAAREAIWLRMLLDELGFAQRGPTLIRGDNQSALTLVKHPAFHPRTKHIGVHFHYARDHVAEGTIVFKWISTHHMAADMMTKGLPAVKHAQFCVVVGMVELDHEGESWRARRDASALWARAGAALAAGTMATGATRSMW